MKNVLMPLANSVLMPLGLVIATSAADAGIQTLGSIASGSGILILIILDKEIKDIIKTS